MDAWGGRHGPGVSRSGACPAVFIPMEAKNQRIVSRRDAKKSERHEVPPREPPLAIPSAAKLPPGYREFLDDLKTRIRTAQVKAALAVNRELIRLYWDIGGMIAERQKTEGWGKSVVERLAADIQHEFPGVSGFSVQNLWKSGPSISHGLTMHEMSRRLREKWTARQISHNL